MFRFRKSLSYLPNGTTLPATKMHILCSHLAFPTLRTFSARIYRTALRLKLPAFASFCTLAKTEFIYRICQSTLVIVTRLHPALTLLFNTFFNVDIFVTIISSLWLKNLIISNVSVLTNTLKIALLIYLF